MDICLEFAWENLTNAARGGVRMVFRPHALKSLNSIERIQLRMMSVTYNGNPCTKLSLATVSVMLMMK